MTIATQKENFASERFLLVRFRPARYIEPSLLSGSTYEMTFNYPIAKLERNGTVLTKVSTLTGDDQFTYNEDTGTLQVRLASAPNDSTNVLIAFYYLFYTGTVFRSISEDPTDATTTTRDWNPRISNYPAFLQSVDNIVSGIFTVNNTSITLINGDFDFQKYLTPDDSFYNKQVDIWLCIDSEANIQKIYTGTVASISLSQNTVTFQINDAFKQLQKPAFMNDTESECIFRRESGGFPNLNPSKTGSICPYIVGSSSRYKTIFNTDSIASAPGYKYLSEGLEGVCVDYSEVVSTSTNRTFGACRLKGVTATQSIASGVREVDTGSYVFLQFNTLSNVTVGDCVKWSNSGTNYGLVVHVGTFTYLGNSYNLIVQTSANFLHSDTITLLKSFGVVVTQSNVQYNALYERDYSIVETATSGGNTYVEIVFVNNFEANLGINPLNPNQDIVFFRASNTIVQTHSQILKDMLEASGLSTNATSFTNADISLGVNARFQIPNLNEISYKTYLDYCQSVLASTLGFLRLNTDFEVVYTLFSTPATGGTRDKDLLIDNQSSIQVEYQDISTKIIAYNPHYEGQEAIDAVDSPSVTAESTKALYLNELENVNRFRHVLEIMTSKITDHINLKSMRRTTYRFSTATEDIDTELGDNLSLDNKIVLGDSNDLNVRVIGIDKAPRKTVIQALDFKGL